MTWRPCVGVGVRCEVLVIMAVLCCSVHIASKKESFSTVKKRKKVLKNLPALKMQTHLDSFINNGVSVCV